MNTITIIGRVNREPEHRDTQGGHSVANVEVVVDREKGRDWFRVAAWGKLSEKVAALKPEQLVAVVGQMQNRRYKDKHEQWRDSWQIEASQVTLLGADASLHDRADEHDGVPF
jgi:single-strand DNA-binding protein